MRDGSETAWLPGVATALAIFSCYGTTVFAWAAVAPRHLPWQSINGFQPLTTAASIVCHYGFRARNGYP
jgi:hypothetical protein